MASFFSSWNPVVSFPPYHGPYDVGTVDVEIPAADLPTPSTAPERAQPTVAFRIFYPCAKPTASDPSRPVRWIPQPQRQTISAFAQFIGVKSQRWANLISYFPQQLYYISLPAHRNAKLLDPPTSKGRWPVTVFSHGLAGSRNAYSYVCGDLASNGTIVIAMDHRDGSSPIQYVRATATTEPHILSPVKISHEPSPEVYEGRDAQLRIRLWEISVAYEALMKIDGGQRLENLDINASTNRKERVEVLDQFDSQLDIHRAGKVTFAGHSFGAATTVQLLKSIFYHRERPADAGKPLIAPTSDAAIMHQITEDSPALLLDMWCLPLQSPDQAYLWDRPLPSYAVGGPAGSNVLSVLSESFWNWEDNLNLNKHTVAAPSRSRRPSQAPRLAREQGRLLPDWARLRDDSPNSSSKDSGYASELSRSRMLSRQRSKTSGQSTPSDTQRGRQSATPANDYTVKADSPARTEGPHMFVVQKSQHFNQSDFGLLFPWIAKRVTKAEEPERILELNVRAMVQVLRSSGIEVAGADDPEVLDKDGEIRRWTHVPIENEDDDRVLEGEEDVRKVQRKLSVISQSGRSSLVGSPKIRDGMTMGSKMEKSLEPLSI
ncbi:platelet-activating factor acetylhydrolase 2 like protein [Zymoseptoria brevis]|uniref:Putative phospholipase n=1 Tax=Zymoseptoria brevis TaxID=1047168 RepID=A0A0F4GGV0_9PEZI|nr:platelet-activating factor acetylhydrolase 2 like protein [Zymoseptoria brevis]